MDSKNVSPEGDRPRAFSAPVLLGIWAALILLIVDLVAMARVDLGSAGPILTLLVAVAMATLVGSFFLRRGTVRPGLLVAGLTTFTLLVGIALHRSPAAEGTLLAGLLPSVSAANAGMTADGGTTVLAAAAEEPAEPASIDRADAERGKVLYNQTCVACHGPNAEGVRALNAPALHLQEDWYIASQLDKFRKGWRGTHAKDVTGMQMGPMAKALPDDQAIYDLGVYIAAIEGPKAASELVGADLEAGKAQYMTICLACHGPDGRGMLALKSPSLVGQSDWYLAAQLKKFKDGIRGYAPEDVGGTQMRPMAMTVPDDTAINNLAAYIASMPYGE